MGVTLYSFKYKLAGNDGQSEDSTGDTFQGKHGQGLMMHAVRVMP